ncbi:MAG: hypothetical protein N3G20_05350 [Verrucomicrobiae bacterium]|nr:hypothetical protein [Verrucomicrobiae bacterium]
MEGSSAALGTQGSWADLGTYVFPSVSSKSEVMLIYVRSGRSQQRQEYALPRHAGPRSWWQGLVCSSILWFTTIAATVGAESPSPSVVSPYFFDRTISRQALENYLSRAITMEGLLNGRGDLEDNIRMLKNLGAKFIGRSLCLWGGEASLLRNLERAKQQAPKVHAADPEMILQACIFEIVTTQVEQVPVPAWVFAAFGRPAENRNFRYADMLYPDGRFKDHRRPG